MTQIYFHCSNTKKVFVDHRGALVDDLAEARDHATRVVQSLANERSLEDWRDWVLHVSDDQGDELFVVPFTFVLGKSH
jgi:sirohydrochlorin ferrochelatase